MARCWDCHGRHNIKPVADPESTVNRRNIPVTCSRCHEDMAVVLKYNIHAESPYQEYRQSVHGRGLYDKGLVDFAAVCTDCHGVHNIQGVGTAHLPAKDPATCGKCHRLVLEEYSRSIHGREALKGNADVPALRGLPRRARGRGRGLPRGPDVRRRTSPIRVRSATPAPRS